MAKLIDANVLLRHLLRDNEEQSEQARIIIAGGAYTTVEVLAEVVYVLEKVYHVPREKIGTALSTLLGEVSTDHVDAIIKALLGRLARRPCCGGWRRKKTPVADILPHARRPGIPGRPRRAAGEPRRTSA